MCDVVAKKMLGTVKTCKLYDRARTQFERHAARNDEIGRGMQRDGLKPLAAVKTDMEGLYEEHRKNARPSN